MGIKLFEHNQSAFDAALDMLSETGKAAAVHPTGTGKSYIGFKLCEQFPDKTICWLSPSEYIFNTQPENLKQDSDGRIPDYIQTANRSRFGCEESGLNIRNKITVI